MACKSIEGGICSCGAYGGCDSLTCNDDYYQVG